MTRLLLSLVAVCGAYLLGRGMEYAAWMRAQDEPDEPSGTEHDGSRWTWEGAILDNSDILDRAARGIFH